MDIRNGKTLCPFHSDSNPSMMVNDKKNIAKCFACGNGGNVISFVQKYEKEVNHNEISINDAIIKVVEICDLDIDVSKFKTQSQNHQYTTNTRKYTAHEKTLIETNNMLNKLFNYNMFVVKDGAFDYLQSRGLSEDLIKKMNLGYAVKGQLLNINENAKINPEYLQELGMIKLGNSGYYEVFENRIMFPICDEKGNIVTFAGRTIKDEKPKYLHTSETPIFHKKELLYNYSNAKNYSYNDELYLVEGYMDVIGAKKKGIDNVVAIMGTAITNEHLNLLKKNNCSLVLALDNDDAGRNAMLDRIPEILKKGFKVDVLDISKLGNFKDFGDIGSSSLTRENIQSAKVSSFTFMMDNYYFQHQNYDVESISKVFERAKNEQFIISTLDELKFKEYLASKTELSKNEISEIIHPTRISEKVNPINNFQNIVMDKFVKQSINDYLIKRDDKVLSSYYESNKEHLDNRATLLLRNNTNKYLSKNNIKLNIALLLYDVLNEDDKYSEYEIIHRFKYNNVFEKTYIKNKNGSAKVFLSFEQKQDIIKQFEDSMRDKEKLALEEVEELYIINDITDIDGILSYNNKTMQMLKDNIKDRMFLNKEKMDFFKYGNLFLNSDKDFISDEFKGQTGDYKTIIFYNNLNRTLKITQEQLMKNSSIITPPKEKNTTELQEEKIREYVFSINRILLQGTKDDSYFIRVPGTNATDYFYLPKNEANWSEDKEMLFTKLKSNKRYKMYNQSGEFTREIDFETFKHHWEDKTKNRFFETKKIENKSESSQKYDEKKTDFSNLKEPEKRPVCKVFKTRIYSRSGNGYYIKTTSKGTLLFISNKICHWNHDKSYLLIYPKKNIFTGTGISRYQIENNKKTFDKRLNFNELGKYLKIFYPASLKKGNKIRLEILRTSCIISDNFVKIPITLDNILGYVRVNIVKCYEEKGNIVVEFPKNEQLSFYSKEDFFVGSYDVETVKKVLETKKNQVHHKVKNNEMNFKSLIDSYKEAIFYSDDDKLEFIPKTIESGYEHFETVIQVRLNGNYLYKPEGRNVARYKNEIVQEGLFKKKDDVVAFLTTYFSDRTLSENTKSEIEKEVFT